MTANQKPEEVERKRVDSKKLLKELEFCVFDLETTGGNHDFDKIIEIGLVRIQNLKIVGERHYFVNPELNIPDFIQKLTDIHEKDIKDAPKIHEIIDDVISFMGDSILVAHNTSFDVPFMNSVLKRLKKSELKNKELCTNMMTKHLVPGIMNSNLSYLGQLFDIEHNKAHRAIEDARATANLLLTYLGFFIEKNIQKVNQIYYPRNRFELDRMNFTRDSEVEDIVKKIKLIKSPILILIKGEQGLLLNTIPIESPKEEIRFIKSELEIINWSTITIRLVVPYLEALLHFNQNFLKSPQENVTRILKYLEATHIQTEKSKNRTDILNEYDFIIAPHLVVEQFVIYPLSILGSKNQLIFKFPFHKKKLSQYVNAHVKRLEQSGNKKKQGPLPDLIPLFNAYLRGKAGEKAHYLILKSSDVTAGPRTFYKQLEAYTKNVTHEIQFPKEHI